MAPPPTANPFHPSTPNDPSNPSTPTHYAPPSTALLLLDFHNLFINQAAGPSGPAALHTAAETATWARSHGIEVIHCLIDVSASPFATCKDRARFEATVAAMRDDPEGSGEPVELRAPSPGPGSGSESEERTFTRRPGHVSALKSPGLESYLQSRGIKSLVLAGLSSSGCVLRTGIAACDAEYVVTTLSDGCADADGAVHEMVVGRLAANRGWVCTAAEWRVGYGRVIEGWKGEGEGEGRE